MIYFTGWFSGAILWFVLSGRNYISEHVSICLQQKSLSGAKPGFLGVRTIFKTCPNFLLSSLVTFPYYILLILLTVGEVMRG